VVHVVSRLAVWEDATDHRFVQHISGGGMGGKIALTAGRRFLLENRRAPRAGATG
jgi:hypothetical protein